MPIKVLVAFHVFPYYRLQVMQALSQDDDVQYTYLAGSAFVKSIKPITPEDSAGGLFQWKQVRNIWLFNGRLLWQKGLIKECLSGKYDGIIFLGNPYFLSTWLAAIFSRLANKKTLFWTHGILRDQLRDNLKLIFYKIAHGLLLYGNWAKQDLIRHGYDPQKIFVVYNALDYDEQEKMKKSLDEKKLQLKRSELFLHSDYPVLLFIGRLMPKKKLDYLISACLQLRRRGMPVNILFIGGGEEEEKLRQLVANNDLQDFVVFLGECYDEKILSTLIAMSDLCVSPGNVGLTAIHALNYGTPVITHDNPLMQGPEYEAIEPGVTGMLYEYDSLDSLVDKIYDWLKMNRDQRELVRNRCYAVVSKHYTPAFQASSIKSAIQKTLSMKLSQ